MPTVKIIGVHPLDLTDELFDESVTLQHGLIALDLDPNRRERANARTRAELAGVVLVELLILEWDRRMFMGEFGQSASGDRIGPGDEVAYGEVFLDAEGEHRVANYMDEIKGDRLRLAFFLHNYRPSRPILTTYGPIEPTLLTAMPRRLRRLVEYKPR